MTARPMTLALATCVVGAACGPGTLVIPAPPTVSLPSTELLAIDGPSVDDGGPFAIELPGAYRLPAPLSREGRHHLSALVYPGRPSELGLSSELAPDREYGPLDARATAFVLDVEDGVASAWTPSMEPFATLAPYVVRRAPTALAVGLGELHTCLVVEGGHLYCSGDGGHGQTGSVGTTATLARVDLGGLDAIVEVGTGLLHTCVRTVDARVHCFGSSALGQLGRAPALGSELPVEVPEARGAVALSVGANTACTLDGAGAILCWGKHSPNLPGDGAPERVTLPGPVERFEVGGNGLCAIVDGVVHCSGLTAPGDPPGTSCLFPVDSPVTTATIAVPEPAVDVAIGGAGACAIGASGKVWCWGCNSIGQLGFEGGSEVVRTPVDVGLTDAVAIELGDRFGCALDARGDLWCFGVNDFGGLGRALPTGPDVRRGPAKLARFTPAPREVRAYWHHACVRLEDGRVSCWGRGADGQLGVAEPRTSTLPLPITW